MNATDQALVDTLTAIVLSDTHGPTVKKVALERIMDIVYNDGWDDGYASCQCNHPSIT